MFRTDIGHNDLAASRFGISPLNELLQAFATLSGFLPDPVLATWVRRTRPRFARLRWRHPGIDALARLWSTWGEPPDFLSPPPAGPEETIDRELAVVRATPYERARAQLDRSLTEIGRSLPAETGAIIQSPDAVARLADGLEEAWPEVMEPDWPMIRTILQKDLLYRANLLANRGWAEALNDLSPRIRWSTKGETGVIEIPRQVDEYHPSDGRGLVFGPSIFWLRVWVDPPHPRAMFYPARGKAALAQMDEPATGDALEKLIGRTRAQVLRALEEPSTTTQLSRQYRMSLGAVGHHLSALRSAGLVVGARTGQSVLYRRTTLGDDLVEANVL